MISGRVPIPNRVGYRHAGYLDRRDQQNVREIEDRTTNQCRYDGGARGFAARSARNGRAFGWPLLPSRQARGAAVKSRTPSV